MTFPILKTYSFTQHDIRRVRSRAVLKDGGEEDARKLLAHKGNGVRMGRLYAGETILQVPSLRQVAHQEVETLNPEEEI